MVKKKYIRLVNGWGAVISLIAIHEGMGHYIYQGCLYEPGLFEVYGDVIAHQISNLPSKEYLLSRELCDELAKYSVDTLRRESNQQILNVSGAVDTTFTGINNA